MDERVISETEAEQKVWLITGCSRGLGRALAAAVLADGHHLAATARNVDSLAGLIGTSEGRGRAFPLDVTDPTRVREVVREVVDVFGRIDVVVNNAGYGLAGAFEELSQERIARNFDVNFFGALEMIRAVLPTLRAQGSGHIVNISAAAAIGNYPGLSIYGAAKMALEGVSESLAAELAPVGIRVTIVQPGPMRTDFLAHSLDRTPGAIADYDRTSGKFLKYLDSLNGKQPIDPRRAAFAILQAVEAPNPPLRLVLGDYAITKTNQKHAAAGEELAAWERVARPVSFAS